VFAALSGSAVLIAAFVLWERHSAHPMLPLQFFRNRRYSAAIASLALVLFSLLGLLFLMTQYLQFGLGFSPLKTGLAIGPVALVLLVVSPLSVSATRQLGTKPVVSAGLILVAVGMGLLSRTTVQSTYADALPFFLLIGAGVGLALAPSTESIMGSLPKQHAGVGSATSDTSMQVGGALGVAVLGTALNMRYQARLSPLLAHLPVPPSIKNAILGSLGGALAVAQRAPGQPGNNLARAARQAFVSGLDVALVVAAVTVAVAAVVIIVALPNRDKHSLAGSPPAPGRIEGRT
jgi:hypothetical protein